LLEDLEIKILQNPESSLLSKILSLKKGLQHFKKITTYQREILHRLTRGEFRLIAQEEMAYYRNVYDHLVRVVDMTESYRDVISGLLEVYLSVTSNRLNEVMKILTMLSTIFLPLTLITGIYGMNFKHMPELDTDLGYYFVWGLLVAVAGGMLLFFRKKGWFD
jgi:magnesium transporter